MTQLRSLLWGTSRRRGMVAVVVAAAAVVVLTQWVMPGGTPAAIAFSGLIDGLTTALVAVALVLVYRAVRIINFAQIAIGGIGAQLAFQLIRYERGVPFVVDIVIAIALSTGVGASFELVMRRFSSAPRLLLTAFTVLFAYFLGEVVTYGILKLPFLPPYGDRPLSQIFGDNALGPFLPFSGLHYKVGHLPVPFGFGQLAAIEISVLGLLAVGVFLRFTRLGTAIRAVAENTERAALLGISVAGISTLVWAIASGLGGAATLAQGISGNPAAAYAFSPEALLPALVAATLARFRSIPTAIGAAIGISILSDSAGYGVSDSTSLVAGGLFALLVIGLFLQRGDSMRVERAMVSWRMVAEPRALPRELAGVGIVRATRYGFLVAIIAAGALYPYLVNTRLVSIGSNIALYAIIALSIVVLTGWAGQISLGQYGFVAIGAVLAGGLTSRAGVSFWLAVPVAVLITALVATLVGLPALRVPGLYLGVASFAFGVIVWQGLFDPKIFGWLLPTSIARPTLFLLNFDNERSMYYLCLFAFLVALALVVNLRRTRVGRLLVALRDNEADVQAMGVRLVRTKLLAFALSGALAGLAGALLAFQLRSVPQSSFTPDNSFIIFIYTLMGGVTSVAGGLLGAGVIYELIQYFLVGNPVLLYLAQALPLVLLYIAPSGIIALLNSARDSALRMIAHRRQMIVPSLFSDQDPDSLERKLLPLAATLPSGGLSVLSADQR
ncbi:MAG: ABC transporter permease subunit, partial [Acidimicrobiales bacterium]